MTQHTQVILAGIDFSDPDNWKLSNYLKRGGYKALRKIFSEKID